MATEAFEISLDASSDVAGLTIAIQSLSDAVEEIRIDIYNSFQSRWQDEGVEGLFLRLGEVPQLRKVEFYGLRIFPYRMPISMAAKTLSRTTRLEEFCLVGVNLSGDIEQFHEFSDVLQHHSSLKAFGLDNCRLADESTGPTLDEAIVSVLIQIPTLEKVFIRAMERSMWGTLCSSSVGLLCRSKTLKSLELFAFSNCSTSFMAEMAKALIDAKDSSQLEEVSISGTLGGLHGSSAISEMFLVNTTLKKLELHLRSRTDDDEPGIMELARALAKNKTLTKFQLHGAPHPKGSWDTRATFLDMLQSNYTLHESALVFHPGFLRPENEIFLKLNAAGRGRLLENTNVGKDEWVNALIRVRDDMDLLFYFLMANPSLCSSSSIGMCSTTIEHTNEAARKRKLSALVTPERPPQPSASLLTAS